MYELWCIQCDLEREREDIDAVFDVKEEHESNYGHRHFVEFEKIEEEEPLSP